MALLGSDGLWQSDAGKGIEQRWLRIEKLRRGDDVLGSARAMGRNEVSGCGKGMIRYAREMKSGVRRSEGGEKRSKAERGDGFDLQRKAKA